ncbi:hypothetical protein BDR26DRAFT_861995 [Obelidium mucronatum]|nr:hypothetical protein BDR26DRAFT_861995 [Obelidium mucronatum]
MPTQVLGGTSTVVFVVVKSRNPVTGEVETVISGREAIIRYLHPLPPEDLPNPYQYPVAEIEASIACAKQHNFFSQPLSAIEDELAHLLSRRQIVLRITNWNPMLRPLKATCKWTETIRHPTIDEQQGPMRILQQPGKVLCVYNILEEIVEISEHASPEMGGFIHNFGAPDMSTIHPTTLLYDFTVEHMAIVTITFCKLDRDHVEHAMEFPFKAIQPRFRYSSDWKMDGPFLNGKDFEDEPVPVPAPSSDPWLKKLLNSSKSLFTSSKPVTESPPLPVSDSYGMGGLSTRHSQEGIQQATSESLRSSSPSPSNFSAPSLSGGGSGGLTGSSSSAIVNSLGMPNGDSSSSSLHHSTITPATSFDKSRSGGGGLATSPSYFSSSSVAVKTPSPQVVAAGVAKRGFGVLGAKKAEDANPMADSYFMNAPSVDLNPPNPPVAAPSTAATTTTTKPTTLAASPVAKKGFGGFFGNKSHPPSATVVINSSRISTTNIPAAATAKGSSLPNLAPVASKRGFSVIGVNKALGGDFFGQQQQEQVSLPPASSSSNFGPMAAKKGFAVIGVNKGDLSGDFFGQHDRLPPAPPPSSSKQHQHFHQQQQQSQNQSATTPFSASPISLIPVTSSEASISAPQTAAATATATTDSSVGKEVYAGTAGDEEMPPLNLNPSIRSVPRSETSHLSERRSFGILRVHNHQNATTPTSMVPVSIDDAVSGPSASFDSSRAKSREGDNEEVGDEQEEEEDDLMVALVARVEVDAGVEKSSFLSSNGYGSEFEDGSIFGGGRGGGGGSSSGGGGGAPEFSTTSVVTPLVSIQNYYQCSSLVSEADLQVASVGLLLPCEIGDAVFVEDIGENEEKGLVWGKNHRTGDYGYFPINNLDTSAPLVIQKNPIAQQSRPQNTKASFSQGSSSNTVFRSANPSVPLHTFGSMPASSSSSGGVLKTGLTRIDDFDNGDRVGVAYCDFDPPPGDDDFWMEVKTGDVIMFNLETRDGYYAFGAVKKTRAEGKFPLAILGKEYDPDVV